MVFHPHLPVILISQSKQRLIYLERAVVMGCHGDAGPRHPYLRADQLPSTDTRNFSHPGYGATVVGVHSGAPEYDTNSKLAILFGRSCGCSGGHLNNEFYP